MPKKNKAIDWSKRCAESNGTMVILPKELNIDADEFSNRSNEYLTKAREFDKLSADFDVFAKNFWHKTRLSLEASGVDDVWGKNIGWNEEAKREGYKVINIMAGGNGAMQMR